MLTLLWQRAHNEISNKLMLCKLKELSGTSVFFWKLLVSVIVSGLHV